MGELNIGKYHIREMKMVTETRSSFTESNDFSICENDFSEINDECSTIHSGQFSNFGEWEDFAIWRIEQITNK